MRPPALALAVLLAGALSLSACAGADESTTAGGTGESASGQAASGEQDVQFATGMRAHHAQAVEMADLVLAAQPAAEVADLARRIKAAQSPEVQELDAVLDELGVEAGASGGHGGHGGHGGGAPAHEGMMTEAQMEQLDDAEGVEAERLFLELMTEHHEGALVSADRQLAEGSNPELREIAQSILDTQRAEIDEMEQLLTGR